MRFGGWRKCEGICGKTRVLGALCEFLIVRNKKRRNEIEEKPLQKWKRLLHCLGLMRHC